MKFRLFFGILVLVIASLSCNLFQVFDVDQPDTPELTPIFIEPPLPPQTPNEEPPAALTLEETAEIVVNALAEMDMATVANYAHPEQGVRFSPYTYVDEDHLVFDVEELPLLIDSDEVFEWGFYDGTGDPIELTFEDYFQKFVYSVDFANPEAMAVNEELGWSSMINNIEEFYPGSSFVEYHFSGFDEQYGGMDWRSLRLVFIEEDGVWFLVGIVNDQWTI